MIAEKQIYKCSICGNIVEVLFAGGGQLVCCGKSMELLQEKTQDQGLEKHVPVIEKIGEKIKVKVGSIPHPMEEKHYIQWIELHTKNNVLRKFLRPGDLSEAEFETKEEILFAREYCNVHGLWRS